MPRFEVVGIGRETGRKRVKIYDAVDKEAAIMAAASEDTIVDVAKTKQLPDVPATEPQKQYAESLTIEFPANIGKVEISRLIDAKLKQQDDQFIKSENALTRATIPQIIENLERRNLGAIIITFDLDKFDFKHLDGTNFSIARTDALTEEQAQILMAGIGTQWLVKNKRLEI